MRKRREESMDSKGSFESTVKASCDASGTGHVIEVSISTAVLRLHAAFPWLTAQSLASLASHQTGRFLCVCQSAVSRLTNRGLIKPGRG